MSTRASDIGRARIGGMQVALTSAFYIGTVLIGAVYFVIGIALFHRSPLNALVGSAVLVVLHWVNELWHNYGHFRAARSTGFPMDGVRLGTPFLLGTSIYPASEGELSAKVHIRRALGGPVANLVLFFVALIATAVLQVIRPHFVWVGIVWALENLLVFVVGNALPLGFNDGSTLLRWWRLR